MTIKVIIAGPRGRMGTEAIKMIMKDNNFELVACIDRINNGKSLKDVDASYDAIPIFVHAKECFQEVEADVFLDLTVPDAGFIHTKQALTNHVCAVVGTSGFSHDEIEQLSMIANENKVGCIIAPNFAIGAVLMMQFAQKAAKYLPDIEIIEKHHDQKLDAPSGTAMKTVDMIKQVRQSKIQGHPDEREIVKHARGAEIDGIRVHSVRLPGLVAHQEVIFGGGGQTLTITHDSYNRESFMSGIKLAIHEVMTLNKLVYGLENIIR